MMKRLVMMALLLGALLNLFGCGAEKKAEKKNTELIPAVSSQSESTMTASGEKQQGARVELVTKEHKMERVIFSGGYLRSLPEESPDTIVREVPKGSQGMIYGKRVINGKEWAKVTTRDGVTGWYAVPRGTSADGKPVSLEETDKVYRSTYPRVTGGVQPRVQDLINGELDHYLAVYRYVTGPVGSDLKCRVTYNRRGILSLVFSGPRIYYRSYPVSNINDTENWKNVQHYAFLSPLWGGADPSIMTAAVTDIQYAMTFDLATGRRMTLYDFIGTGNSDAVKDLMVSFGDEARMDSDDFYVDEKGQLFLLVRRQQPEPGKETLNLSRLVAREY
jgi:hypothetical protein